MAAKIRNDPALGAFVSRLIREGNEDSTIRRIIVQKRFGFLPKCEQIKADRVFVAIF